MPYQDTQRGMQRALGMLDSDDREEKMSDSKMSARLRDLEKKHSRAVRHRDKWAAEAEQIEARLNAYRLVMEDLGEKPSTAGGAYHTAGVAESVRDAVSGWEPGAEFTPGDLRTALPPEHQGVQTSSITNALKRMLEDEDAIFELVEVGAGKRQSRYRRLEDDREREEDNAVTPFRRVVGEG